MNHCPTAVSLCPMTSNLCRHYTVKAVHNCTNSDSTSHSIISRSGLESFVYTNRILTKLCRWNIGCPVIMNHRVYANLRQWCHLYHWCRLAYITEVIWRFTVSSTFGLIYRLKVIEGTNIGYCILCLSLSFGCTGTGSTPYIVTVGCPVLTEPQEQKPPLSPRKCRAKCNRDGTPKSEGICR